MPATKVAIITCYKEPDYVRGTALQAAAETIPGVQVIRIKNRHLGILRYAEVITRVLLVRIKHRPDKYLLTFRGYEILPFLSLITFPKPFIFDEFINPLEWLYEPRPEWWAHYVPKRLLRFMYRLLLRRPAIILADTEAHADSSAKLTYGERSNKYIAIPVGTDETVFKPTWQNAQRNEDTFRVFYYGNMLPLHGLGHLLAAAIQLKDQNIEFKIVGGGEAVKVAVHDAQAAGARLEYESRVPFHKLPNEVNQAHLCIGGPLGNTRQAQQVVTGKTYQFMASDAPTLIGKNEASEAFTDKKDCLMTPLGDAGALAETILWASKHRAELTDIGRNGRLLYESRFSSTALAKQLEAIL